MKLKLMNWKQQNDCFFLASFSGPLFFGGLLLVALRAGVHIGDTDGREKLGDKPAWAAGCIGWPWSLDDVVTIEITC